MSYADHLENLKAIAATIGAEGIDISQSTAQTYINILDACIRLEKFLDNDGGIQHL